MLQEAWSIAVLGPNSVSIGRSDMQLDFAPQSPHPSQTSGWMMARSAGSARAPRLRSRRFFFAHIWS